MSHFTFVSLLGAALLLGCGNASSNLGQGAALPDGGQSPSGPCVPGTEVCDGADNDCDGSVDEGFDQDGDGVASCGGDCDDTSAAIHPGATETLNAKDDDCDGHVDNRIAGNDADKDGTPYPADCNDDEPLVGPGALEVAGDNTDNNCDGRVDEPAAGCDGALGAGSTSAADFAKALGLCQFVEKAEFISGDATARSIRAKFGGTYAAREGAKMVLLSSGIATDTVDTPDYTPQEGMDFDQMGSENPAWTPPPCGPKPVQAPATHDLTELRLTLRVPQNAKSFSYEFNFFSAEYPEWVCKEFDDRFIALLESKAFKGNISFDANKNPITVNNNFFQVCTSTTKHACSTNVSAASPGPLAGTGYDLADPDISAKAVAGGATGWLSTSAPATGGDVITLHLFVFDEGDGILDSAVLLDNFKWELTPVTAPVTSPIN